MKLTSAACYALHALAYMAQQRTTAAITSQKIAQEKGIPIRFLLKVLKPLVDSGLLESKKGPTGGYMLARPASEITVLDIVEASEGTINGEAVLPEPKDEDMDNFPNFKPENVIHVHNKLNHLCKQAAESVRKQFEKVKLSDLLKK
jgi:Rrf2 family protein